MKTILTTLLASTALVLSQNANDRYTQLLYQIEYDQNGAFLVEHQINVEKEGTIDAMDGVDFSSRFELHCIDSENPSLDPFIAEQLVSAYLPTGSITITSLDLGTSYGKARTRVDQPYTVGVTVSGIIENDPTLQEAARMIHFDKDISTFSEGVTQLSDDAATNNTQSNITTAGNTSATYVSQIEATKSGAATYSLSTLVDFDAESSSLANETIYIWPLSTGSLEGVVERKTYATLPALTVDLIDVYPEATARLRVTNLDTGLSHLAIGWHSKNNNESTQSKNDTFDGSDLMKDSFPIDGEYKIELVEDSVFGIRVLDTYQPITIKRSVAVNGHFTEGN